MAANSSSCRRSHRAAARGAGASVTPLAAGLGLLVALPLASARLLYDPATDGVARLWACPLLQATGVPCPACGATRSFVYFAQGDTRFLDYNWMWLIIWGGLIAFLLLLLVHRLRHTPRLGRAGTAAATTLRKRTWLAVALPFALLIPAWAVALANVDAISAGIR